MSAGKITKPTSECRGAPYCVFFKTPMILNKLVLVCHVRFKPDRNLSAKTELIFQPADKNINASDVKGCAQV